MQLLCRSKDAIKVTLYLFENGNTDKEIEI